MTLIDFFLFSKNRSATPITYETIHFPQKCAQVGQMKHPKKAELGRTKRHFSNFSTFRISSHMKCLGSVDSSNEPSPQEQQRELYRFQIRSLSETLWGKPFFNSEISPPPHPNEVRDCRRYFDSAVGGGHRFAEVCRVPDYG